MRLRGLLPRVLLDVCVRFLIWQEGGWLPLGWLLCEVSVFCECWGWSVLFTEGAYC